MNIGQRGLRTWSGTGKRATQHAQRRKVTSGSHATIRSRRNAAIFLCSTAAVCAIFAYPRISYAEVVPTPAEITFEKKRKKAKNVQENREILSSQHLQTVKSWEKPGVFVWGSNTGRVAGPNSDEANIKTPRRIPYFDGKLLRDIKLDRSFGAAILENGDLVQWGSAFAADVKEPVHTLVDKNLVKLAISRDRIIALSKSGRVYSLAHSRDEQDSEPRVSESSWIPFWNSKSSVGCRQLQIDDLAWSENITDITSGLEHALLLTSAGRLYSFASGTEDFPSRGQLGIPGLTWATRPAGPYYKPHEINTLKGFAIKKIAAGDFHSVALDDQGRVFSWGDNSLGQLGFDVSNDVPSIDAPSLIPVSKLYAGTSLQPRVTNISAGGPNSFFMIDAKLVAAQGSTEPSPLLGRITADVWGCGQGLFGQLGNGRWTHVQGTPTKIKSLSGLFEYDETNRVTIPIRLARLSVGATHAAAVMDNVTHVGATSTSGDNDTNWGADVLWWGSNEHYQLGTGRRNNVSTPVYIAPMESEPERNRQEHRFQITPRKKATLGDGRTVEVEQRLECGRYVSAVYLGL